MPRLKSPKQKGDRFERELADYLRDRVGLADCHRVPLSGGGVGVGRATGDLEGTPLISIEAKAVQNLSVREALRQSKRNASPGDLPVVINRRNRESTDDAVVSLRLTDFCDLYIAALRYFGHLKEPITPGTTFPPSPFSVDPDPYTTDPFTP